MHNLIINDEFCCTVQEMPMRMKSECSLKLCNLRVTSVTASANTVGRQHVESTNIGSDLCQKKEELTEVDK